MIQVIGRALDILELLAKEPERVKSLSEIANTLNLNHGTCANIIKTLVDRKYVRKLEPKQGYLLGMMAFELAGKKDLKDQLIIAAEEEMKKLTKQFNENTLLAQLKGTQRLAILKVNSHNMLQAITPTEKAAYNSSSGKLLIAMLDKEELENYLRQFGLPQKDQKGKPISKTRFYRELETIRKEQVATHLPDDEIFGLAVPVFKENKVVASLSMYLPAYRFNADLKKQMLKELHSSAFRISQNLNATVF